MSLQVGRDCPDGEHGLAGPNTAANTKVFLAGKSHRWTVAHVRGDCTLVNIIDSVSICRRFGWHAVCYVTEVAIFVRTINCND